MYRYWVQLNGTLAVREISSTVVHMSQWYLYCKGDFLLPFIDVGLWLTVTIGGRPAVGPCFV